MPSVMGVAAAGTAAAEVAAGTPAEVAAGTAVVEAAGTGVAAGATAAGAVIRMAAGATAAGAITAESTQASATPIGAAIILMAMVTGTAGQATPLPTATPMRTPAILIPIRAIRTP